jgi:hypothetical protein
MKQPFKNSRKARILKPRNPNLRPATMTRLLGLAVDCCAAFRREADAVEAELLALQRRYDAILAALDIADGRAPKGGRP